MKRDERKINELKRDAINERFSYNISRFTKNCNEVNEYSNSEIYCEMS